MNTQLRNLATSVLLSTALLGCTKPTQSPVPSWNLEALARDEQAYNELQNPSPQPTLQVQTSKQYPLFITTNAPIHPACHDTNHYHITQAHSSLQQLAKATIQRNMALTHQISNYASQITGLTNQHTEKLQIEIGELRTKTQGLGAQLADYQKREQLETREQRKIETDGILIQTVLATQGYVIPGSPIVSGTLHKNRLVDVVTHHFSLPRVALTTELFDETLAQLGDLGYQPEKSEGAFSNWVHNAGLPLKAFPGYQKTPIQHDRAAVFCRDYATSLNGPLPGIVVWTNKAGTHFIGSEQAVTKWRKNK